MVNQSHIQIKCVNLLKKTRAKKPFKRVTRRCIDTDKDLDKINDDNKTDLVTKPYIKALYEMSGKKCYWCKKDIHCNIGNKDLKQFSTDRLDNSKGHVINNIKITCLFCNFARNDCDEPSWKEYIKTLTTNHQPDFSNQIFNNTWSNNLRSSCVTIDRRMCKKRNLEYNLDMTVTAEWIRKQYEKSNLSHYTKIPMFPSKTRKYCFKPSVERIDNNKLHTRDNCVLVCMVENHGRNDTPYDDFIKFINERYLNDKKLIKK